MPNICPKCGKDLGSDFVFCPYCGYQNNQQPSKLSTFNIIKIYLGSFFLSPLSLYWFFKYYKNPETKKVAYISLAITLIVFIGGVLTAYYYMKAVEDSIHGGIVGF